MNDKRTIRELRDANLKSGSAIGVAILDALYNEHKPHPLQEPSPAILQAPFRIISPTKDQSK